MSALIPYLIPSNFILFASSPAKKMLRSIFSLENEDETLFCCCNSFEEKNIHKLLAHYPNKYAENFLFFLTLHIYPASNIDYNNFLQFISVLRLSAELHIPIINFKIEKKSEFNGFAILGVGRVNDIRRASVNWTDNFLFACLVRVSSLLFRLPNYGKSYKSICLIRK